MASFAPVHFGGTVRLALGRKRVVSAAAGLSGVVPGRVTLMAGDRGVKLDAAKGMEQLELPKGFEPYELMLVFKADVEEDKLRKELDVVDKALASGGAKEVESINRGRQRLAYAMKGASDGQFILYSYISLPACTKGVLDALAAPSIGDEKACLRYMAHRV